jgi:hypothetical protein
MNEQKSTTRTPTSGPDAGTGSRRAESVLIEGAKVVPGIMPHDSRKAPFDMVASDA